MVTATEKRREMEKAGKIRILAKKKEMSDEELLQHELLEQIKELEAGVEDQEEDYDIEREIEPEKEKAARKGKARKKKK